MSEGTEKPNKVPPGYPFWVRAERIRNERIWSQSELAERAGVVRKTYSLLKTQPNKATPRTISRLAAVLDIPRAEAMLLAGLDPVADSVGETVAEPEAAEMERLQTMLDRLPPRSREALERRHIEEKARFENQVRQARADWRRALGHLAERAELEIELSQRQPSEGDDKEGDSDRGLFMQMQ